MRVLTPCVLVSALAISACGGTPITLEITDPSSSDPSGSGSSSSGPSSSGSSSSEGGSSVSADAGADAVSDAGTYDGNPADLWDGNPTDARIEEIAVCSFPGFGNIIVCDNANDYCPIPTVGQWDGFYGTFACTDPGCACTITEDLDVDHDVDGSPFMEPHIADGTVGSFVQLGEP